MCPLQRLDRGLFVNAEHNGLLGRGRYRGQLTTSAALAVKSGSLLSHQDLRALRSILWRRRNRQTYWTSTSPSAWASSGPLNSVQILQAVVCPAAQESACRLFSCRSAACQAAACLQALQALVRHSDAATDSQSAAAPRLPWRSTACCDRPQPTEQSAPASNHVAMSPASDNELPTPCDRSVEGELLLLRESLPHLPSFPSMVKGRSKQSKLLNLLGFYNTESGPWRVGRTRADRDQPGDDGQHGGRIRSAALRNCTRST